jgi:hypothetical protein
MNKTAAILQIVVMLLLQFSAVAPGLARSLNNRTQLAHCSGDHARCGCSPERIASRSCCCFQSKRLDPEHNEPKPVKHSCCKTEASAEMPDSHDDDDRLIPAISSIPCGSDSRFIAASAENIKFISPSLLCLTPVPTVALHFPNDCKTYTSRYLAPPDQPPEISPSV